MASSSSSVAAPAPAPPVLDGPSRGFFYIHRDRGVILSQPGGHSVKILLSGAHVVSWMTSGRENLFMLADFKRGGIRICFPEVFEKQGFARRRLWICDFKEKADMPDPPKDDIFADFRLNDMYITPADYAKWHNKFQFWLRFILRPTGQLSMISRIKNLDIDGRSFRFTFSYDNYFYALDIGAVRIEGLEGRDYVDRMRNNERFNQGGGPLTFNSAVHRLYLSSPDKIIAKETLLRKTFTIEKCPSLPNIVVWHPRNDDHRRMVCVNAAAQGQGNEIKLIPGQVWMATQHLSVTVLNYNMKI